MRARPRQEEERRRKMGKRKSGRREEGGGVGEETPSSPGPNKRGYKRRVKPQQCAVPDGVAQRINTTVGHMVGGRRRSRLAMQEGERAKET